MAGTSPERQVAEVAGRSYGRLLALLAAPTGDIPAAEDALSDALERALSRWPAEGVPVNPEGWLLTVARNRLRDLWKSQRHRTSVPLGDHDVAQPAVAVPVLADRRLELMLVCAHPAIAANVRTPLMLQTVLGVDAATIATAFAVPEATMAQRLVRAKRRIKDARIPFAVPARPELAARLPAVLETVYGACAVDWPAPASDSLTREALHLAGQLAEVLPDEPEVLGLAALLCFVEARRAARCDDGAFVPLDEQDASRWDATLLARGEELLVRAHALGRPGRFQYEAALQSAHCHRPVDWRAVRRLYSALLRVSPSLGTRVALAAVDGEIFGTAEGLAALEAIDDPALPRFQPAWATRAHLLVGLGDRSAAAEAYRQAIRLSADDAVRAYLAARLALCEHRPT